jgi:hypothetical protein
MHGWGCRKCSTALRACPNISTTAHRRGSKNCERSGHDTKPLGYSRGSRSPRNSQSIDVSPGSALPHAVWGCLKTFSRHHFTATSTLSPSTASNVTRASILGRPRAACNCYSVVRVLATRMPSVSFSAQSGACPSAVDLSSPPLPR